ncbi:MAG: DNA mismatch repair protein MutS, partial [Clostridia bacterium]|nr:DNA mismatch repair protein MutS [Clostridia bacterium]
MSPMMEQYFKIKEQYRDYLLFYRLGDFYEMFFDDAKTASRELELTLTGRDCGENERAPMCGVPFHSADSYIQKLIAKGYKVAICEQTEDPATAKGLVKREVIRIVTAGTVLEPEMLQDGRNNYLASVCLDGDSAGVCFADVSTGEVFATSFTSRDPAGDLICELGTYSPSEVLLSSGAAAEKNISKFILEKLGASTEAGRDGYFEPASSEAKARTHFGSKLPENAPRQLLRSLGALLCYVEETQKSDISYIKDLNIYDSGRFMQLDLATRRNLELTETMRTREKKGSLLGVLDRTKTAAGARMLRQWIEHPLLNIPRITRRQSAVGELASSGELREELRDRLTGVLDLERLVTKTVYGSANARDLRAVCSTLSKLPDIIELLGAASCEELRSVASALDPLEDITGLIDRAIIEAPPFSVREGGMIAPGYSEEVDRLRDIMNNGRDWIEREAEKERDRTGIRTLKIGYNRVFGYYIEVSNSFKAQVPPTYIRKQTLANAERYITEELKRHEAEVLGASDRLASLEYGLFCTVRDAVAAESARIQRTAAGLAALDVYASLAEVAVSSGYVC